MQSIISHLCSTLHHRTLLKGPAVMLFDEATSALDSRTERNIQQALVAASARRTVLVIAHRLSTVVAAHQIVVLEGGRLVERGNHAELVEAGGKYKELWDHQRQQSDA